MLALIADVDRKKSFMLAPIALIPDMDTLLMAHRIYLYTIFIPLAIIALIPFFLNTFGRKEHNYLFWLASFYYLSHIILDFFPGPVAILWPLTDVGYGVWVGVRVNQQSVIPTLWPYFAVIVEQTKVSNGVMDVSVVTSQSIAAVILFLAILSLKPVKKRLQKGRV